MSNLNGAIAPIDPVQVDASMLKDSIGKPLSKRDRQRQRQKENKKKSTPSHLKACRENSAYELIISVLPQYRNFGKTHISRFTDPKISTRHGDDTAIKKLIENVLPNWKGRMYHANLYTVNGDRKIPLKRFTSEGLEISETGFQAKRKNKEENTPLLKLAIYLYSEDQHHIREMRKEAFQQLGIDLPSSTTTRKTDRLQRKILLENKSFLIRPILPQAYLTINPIINSIDLKDGKKNKLTALLSLISNYHKAITHEVSRGIVQKGLVYLQVENKNDLKVCEFTHKGEVKWHDAMFKAQIRVMDKDNDIFMI